MLRGDLPLNSVAVWPVVWRDKRRELKYEPNTIISRPALTAHLLWDKQWGICGSACNSSDQFDLDDDRSYTTLLSDERYVVDIYKSGEQALMTANSTEEREETNYGQSD